MFLLLILVIKETTKQTKDWGIRNLFCVCFYFCFISENIYSYYICFFFIRLRVKYTLSVPSAHKNLWFTLLIKMWIKRNTKKLDKKTTKPYIKKCNKKNEPFTCWMLVVDFVLNLRMVSSLGWWVILLTNLEIYYQPLSCVTI